MSNTPSQPQTPSDVLDLLRKAFDEAGYGPNGQDAPDDAEDDTDGD